MKDESKTKRMLISELREIRDRISKLENPAGIETDNVQGEEEFKNIFENIIDVYYRADLEGKLLSVSPSGVRLLDYDSDAEMIGKDIASEFYYYPEERAAILEALKKHGKVICFEGTLKKKDGTPVVVETSARVVRGKDGNPIASEGIIRDVTERKQAEEALQESETKYKELVRESPDAIVTMDINGRLTSLNPAAVRVMGFSEQEIAGRRFTDIGVMTFDSQLRATKEVEAVLAGREPRPHELTMIRKDKSKVVLEVISHPIMRDNEIQGLQIVSRDITERKWAENALRESHEFSTSLLSSSPNPIVVANPDSSIMYANPAFEKLTGYSYLDIMDIKAPYPWWTEESNHYDARTPEDIFRKAEKVEHLYRNKSGDEFWVEITTAPVKSEEEVRYYLSNWVDITDRKYAREALKESEEKYRRLVVDSHDIVYSITSEGVFTFMGPQISRYGYEPEEVVGKNFAEIIHPDDAEVLGKEFEETMTTGREFFSYFRLVSKDGSIAYMEEFGRVVRKDGEIAGLSGVVRDITERKQAEKALRKSEERYRTLVGSSRDAIMMLTPEKGFFDGNPATVKIFGCRDEKEFISLAPADLSPEYQPDGALSTVKAQQMMAIAMEKGSHFFDWTHKRMDGEEFFATVLLTRMELQGYDVLQATVRDITEQKKAEKALRESEEWFRALVETTSDWIWEVDRNGVYTYASPKVKEILGYDPEEVVGRTPFDFMPPDEAERIAGAFGDIAESGMPFKGLENKNLHRNGRLVVLETSGVPIFDDDGNLAGYRGIDRDITERKESEVKREG